MRWEELNLPRPGAPQDRFGDAFMVSMVQTPSDGTWQPMDSPPGIHTIPFGAFDGSGVWLGTVGAKAEVLVSGATTSPATACESRAAFMASTPKR